MSSAKLTLDGKDFELPVTVGSEKEVGIDIANLRSESKAITLDPGYGNTGSCQSAITFIDGEKGILRYRGYPIEELCEKVSFAEVCQLLIYDRRLSAEEVKGWRRELALESFLPNDMIRLLQSFPENAHPMSVLISTVAALAAFYPYDAETDNFELDVTRLLAKASSIAAYEYKRQIGQPIVYPLADHSYAANFLRMVFATPAEDYEVAPELERALNMLLIVHADHEQNCSTSSVRMVGSSQAPFYASIAAGICGLWGPRHGGANQAVLEMLTKINNDNRDYKKYVELAKDKESGFRLMGFGHRVYKNFDPRANILKKSCDEVLNYLGINDPLLEIAKNLEQVALEDEFFVERKLYPNVDFYSGIIYRALGIPTNMFTVMFALGRMPGWIAHWKEMREEPGNRIHRPRQIYTGETERHW
jgi:citrate synthase